MATSDNVVRAGLTPKLRDVPTLVDMLTYNAAPAHAQLLQPTPFRGDNKPHQDGKSLLYDPPIDEFSVVKVELQAGQEEAHAPVDGPSIIIVTEGAGKMSTTGGSDAKQEVAFERGDVLFVAAGQAVEYRGKKSEQQTVVLYRAYVEA